MIATENCFHAGLVSALYSKDGKEVPNPDPSSGLYISSRSNEAVKAPIPASHVAFQMGEAMQVIPILKPLSSPVKELQLLTIKSNLCAAGKPISRERADRPVFPLQYNLTWIRKGWSTMILPSKPVTFLHIGVSWQSLLDHVQVHSGGLLRATPHFVKMASGPASEGVARNTLAIFMQPR